MAKAMRFQCAMRFHSAVGILAGSLTTGHWQL